MTTRRSSAFTLVELLVVVAIIGVLIALLLPTLNKARLAAKDTQCKSQLRQIVMGLTMYTNDHKGYYPYTLQGRIDPSMLYYDNTEGTFTNLGKGPGDYDLRPELRRYFGTNVLAKILKCPLAAEFWTYNAASNIDKNGAASSNRTKIPYVLYFGPRCYAPSDPDTAIDTFWLRSRYMIKAGQKWSPASSAASNLRFTIIASDFVFWNGFAGIFLATTHADSKHSDGEGGNWTNWNWGGTLLPNSPTTGWANFAQSDGSVVGIQFKYDSLTQKTILGIRRQSTMTYCVPAELGN